MANTNYILQQIKVEGVLSDLIAKSNGENVAVTYSGKDMTLAAALTQIFSGISALPTDEGVDGKISAAIGELVNGAPETGDTLKELFDLIGSNKNAMETLNEAIGAKASKAEFDALKAVVEGLGGLAAKSQVEEADLTDALKKKINDAADAGHSHGNKAVLDGITAEKVSSWDGKAEKTAATTTVDGLMSASDKARLDGIRGVRYGTSAPADMQDGELFIRVVASAAG